MTLGIDISNYTGHLTLDRVQTWKDLGAKRVVVGLQFPARTDLYPAGCADQQLEVLTTAGGLDIEVYFESTPLDEAWNRVQRFRPNISRAWLACETGSGWETAEAIRRGLRSLAALRLPKPAGIYTAAWWWVPNIGTDEFMDRPLWVANYDRKPDLNFAAFAGWDKAVMKQFTGDAVSENPLWGGGVDLNWFEDGPALSPKPGLTDIYLAAFGMLGRRLEPIEPDERFNRAVLYWPK